jgi:CheY-like chemotaxis protein
MNDTVMVEKSKKIPKINSVLVVDDNKTIQDTMSFILENLGPKSTYSILNLKIADALEIKLPEYFEFSVREVVR